MGSGPSRVIFSRSTLRPRRRPYNGLVKHRQIFFLFTLAISTASGADLGVEVGKLCDRADVRRARGRDGTCRVVVAPRKVVRKVTCNGTFLRSMNCEVDLDAGPESALVGVTCGANLRRPTIAQESLAAVTAFRNAAVVTDAGGAVSVVEDSADHLVAMSELAQLTLVDGGGQLSGTVELTLPNGRVPLTGVVCRPGI